MPNASAIRRSIAAAGLVLLASGSAHAQWGDLSGQIILPNAPINAIKVLPPGFCGGAPPLKLNETLVVGPKGELANVVIWVTTKNVQVKPGLVVPPNVNLDNVGCRFEPHVVGMQVSQTLVIRNQDGDAHNAKLNPIVNAGANFLIPAGGNANFDFKAVESLPVKVECNIHQWMGAWVLAKDIPYFAITDANGKFTIKNLPVGPLDFRFWHERPGYLKTIWVKGMKTPLVKGTLPQNIAAGNNDLGAIDADPKEF